VKKVCMVKRKSKEVFERKSVDQMIGSLQQKGINARKVVRT
jgi:hypothetical protein